MSSWGRGTGSVPRGGGAAYANQGLPQPQDLPSLDDLRPAQGKRTRQVSNTGGSASTALAHSTEQSNTSSARPLSAQNAWTKHQATASLPASTAAQMPSLPGTAVPTAGAPLAPAKAASGGGAMHHRPSAPFDAYIVLDFEATCEKDKRLPVQEVIEFPMVVVDPDTSTVVAEFQRYVRPVYQPTLTPFCTELTGIAQATVDQAEPFDVVYGEVLAWLTSGGFADRRGNGARSYCFVTCGDWDLRQMLPAQMQHSARAITAAAPPERTQPPGAASRDKKPTAALPELPRTFYRWINIKHVFETVMRRRNGGSMVNMLHALNLPLLGRHHSGIDDCRNIARILMELMRRVDPSTLLPTSCEPGFQPWRLAPASTDSSKASSLSWPASSVVAAPAAPVVSPPSVAAPQTPPSPALQLLLAHPPPKRAPNDQEKTTFSKKLSLFLRHRAQDVGLAMTAAGLVRVGDLLKLPHFKHLDLYTLGCLVRDCPKQRFRVVVDDPQDVATLWIGANQGHSLQGVEADLRPITDAAQCPVAVHGTYHRAWPLIVQSGGLSRMTRQHVHFAKGLPGESQVMSGMRSSAQILVYLNVPKMLHDKVPLFESQNGVILSPGVGDTGMIPMSYFSKVEDSRTHKPIAY